MRRSDAPIRVKIRVKQKKCPSPLLDCPEEAKVLADGQGPDASALKAQQDALKKKQTDLRKEKAILAIKRAQQRLQKVSETRKLSSGQVQNEKNKRIPLEDCASRFPETSHPVSRS
jgi:hypothetical protein